MSQVYHQQQGLVIEILEHVMPVLLNNNYKLLANHISISTTIRQAIAL